MVYILNVKMSFGWTCLGSKKLTMWLLKTHLLLKEVGTAEKSLADFAILSGPGQDASSCELK